MYFFKRNILKLFLFIFSFLCFFYVVYANDGVVITHSGFDEAGGGGSADCFATWGACYVANKYNTGMGFRFTLVYASGSNAGKKATGTHSVDFSSNDHFLDLTSNYKHFGIKSKRSDVYDEKTGEFVKTNYLYGDINGVKYGKITGKFTSYKYSDYYNDYNILTEHGGFDAVYINNSKNGAPFKDEKTISAFFNGDFKESNSKNWTCSASGRSYPCSFLDFFLHMTGYLKENQLHYDDKRDDNLNNYVILVEPTYAVYFKTSDGTLNRYGTVTEIANAIESGNYSYLSNGMGRELTDIVRLCMSTSDKNGKYKDFAPLASGIDKCNSGVKTGWPQTVTDRLAAIARPDSPYGINFGEIEIGGDKLDDCPPGEICEPPIDVEHYDSKFILKSCSASDGNKISFITDNSVPLEPLALKDDDLKVNYGADEAQSIYCYDSVNYYFNDIIDYIDGKSFNRFSFINLPSSSAIVDRYCLLGKNESGSAVDYNILNDLTSYKENGIQLYFYGNTYDILPSNIDNIDIVSNIENDNVEDSLGNKYRYVKYQFTLNYEYPKDTLFIGVDSKVDYNSSKNTNVAYISLTNWNQSFGASRNLWAFDLNAWNSDKLLYKGRDSSFKLPMAATANSDSNDIVPDIACPIKYSVSDSKTDISFRVIDLNNPFPARDGTSRMPSENWLYDENNVYSYITNNRAVLGKYMYTDESTGEIVRNSNPEYVYNLEPMYTVTLTPSTMIKIRNYNKEFSYYSMYDLGSYNSKDNLNENDKNADKLRCDEYGRECYSEFLRDNRYLPQESSVGGVCFFGGNTTPNKDEDASKIRKEFNQLRDNCGMERIFTAEDVSWYTDILLGNNEDEKKLALDYCTDLNFNGRFDSEDIEIMRLYAKSNYYKSWDEVTEALQNGEISSSDDLYTSYKYNAYYTCAYKTFKSGGPVEEGE